MIHTIAHIAECVMGVFAVGEDGKIITFKRFSTNPSEVAKKLLDTRKGVPTAEHRELVRDLIKNGVLEFTLESDSVASSLSKEFKRAKFSKIIPNPAGEALRERFDQIAVDIGLSDPWRMIREVSMEMTRALLHSESEQRDRLIIQAIKMVDEIDKFINTIMSQCREWYSIHFPELDRLVPDHMEYLRLVLGLGLRSSFTEDSIKKIAEMSDERCRRLAESSRTSHGGTFDDADIIAIRGCLQRVSELYSLRGELAKYIEEMMEQVAPNLKAVVGGAIGARLISIAGGLANLARMPASTIQILGAEKALFRALKTRARPPKHGVIYQFPEIRSAPKKLRGKIARALSGKIAIAARVDAMSGEFIGDKLAADLENRLSAIRSR